MNSHPITHSRLQALLVASAALAFAASAHAAILTFDGDYATGVTTHTIAATDWADYLGGSVTFNSANAGGRLFWRGSAGDGQYMHFDLSSLTGLTVVAPTTITLQDANPNWGGGVDGSFVATANGAWTAVGGEPIPGATAISNAVNATGSYGWDAAISWGIGYSTFQGFVNDQANFYGLAVIGGSGSQMHFDSGMNPYLTVKTGTLTTGTVISADTGSATWNSSNYNFVDAGDTYNPINNVLTISGELIAGSSGAGTVTINSGGTVAVNQGGGTANYYWAVDGTTINSGGKLTINGHSNIQGLTLAGGELASTGTDPDWGSWGINGTTAVTGGVVSTISAQQVTLSGGTFDVGTGSTLNFTGSTRGTANALVKNGDGTMKFTGWQSYTGGTTINAGTLEVIGQSGGSGWLRGAVTVNTGGTLLFTGGDGSGFGWNNPVSSLTIDGGTFNAAGSAHVGFGANLTVGLSNGGTISGNGQWNGDGLLGFSSSGNSTNTMNGSWVLRSDNGADHTFTVTDGTADVDFQVNANFSDQYPEAWWLARSNLIKAGAGTMVLAGNNSYDGQTRVNEGTLVAAGSTALGPGGWNGATMTWVYNGATLALQGGISLDEHMHVYGAGVGGKGAIRSLSGDNALTMTYGGSGNGPGISIDSNTTIGVDADTLTSTGFYEDGGSWGLTKVGAGTLRFTQASTYTGGTVIDDGTLILDGGSGGTSRIRGALTVNSGATVSLINDDGTGLGYNPGAKVTSLIINGGTVTSAGTMHVWNLSGVNMTGGTLQSNNGVSDANGPQMEWINSDVTTNASDNTATIGGRIRMRGDGGAPGISFAVADGVAATDLLVSAAITEAGGGRSITKNGTGTMEISGANSYTGSTIVNEGTLVLSGTSSSSASIIVNTTGTLALSSPVLDDAASVVIDTGATMHLGFTGEDFIGNLEIAGSGLLPPGTYDSSHPDYGSYFTGSGSLVVPSANGTWYSLADGNWSDASNWEGDTIAAGSDRTATFSDVSGVVVTVDSGRKIGNLVFDTSDYTLAGPGTLTLEASLVPVISVGIGRIATISAPLAGTGGIEKTGDGTLVFSGVKSYTGGTTVTGGTLELAGGSGGNSIIRGALTINPGTTVALTGGDGSGFGWNYPVPSITVNGGTLNAATGAHVGFGGGTTMSLENGGTIAGAWNWNGDGLLSVSTSGGSTTTINGVVTLRADAGASHTFNVVDGAAAVDLQINANLSDQWPEYPVVPASGLTKAGSGTMVLNGTNTYDGNTVVANGALEVTATASLHFRPTTNGQTNAVSGATISTLTFAGTVDLDLGAAEAAGGNNWNLFDLASFSYAALTPAAVTSSLGAFSEVSSGTWELPVTGAKWVFTAADGNLAYVVTTTDYDNWKSDNGVTGGPDDDDDNDGLSNREEYAFGLDPTGATSLNPIAVPLDPETGTFSYTRRSPQSLTGLTYTIWYSTDLSGWTEDTDAEEGTPIVNGEVETVPVTLTTSLLANPSLFIQVRAE